MKKALIIWAILASVAFAGTPPTGYTQNADGSWKSVATVTNVTVAANQTINGTLTTATETAANAAAINVALVPLPTGATAAHWTLHGSIISGVFYGSVNCSYVMNSQTFSLSYSIPLPKPVVIPAPTPILLPKPIN